MLRPTRDPPTRLRWEGSVPSNPFRQLARCSVAGTTECNIRDLFFLKQQLDLGPGVGSVELRCDAALSPPPLP